MRLNDILTERQQNEMHMLQEAPLGSLIRKAGRGVGKAVGGVATGIGAVAGGIAGIGSALKKGFQAGKSTVSGDASAAGGAATPTAAGTGGAATPTAAGTGGAAGGAATPTAAGTGGAATPTAAGTGGAATPTAAGTGGAATPATTPVDTPPAAPAAAPAAAPEEKPPAAVEPQPDAEYDKAQKAVEALPDEQKKEIIGLLQADPKVKAAMAEPPPTQGKQGVSQPGRPTFTGVPDKPAAVDPSADATAEPTPKGRGGRRAGAEPSQTPRAVRRRDNRKAAKAQKQADAAKFNTGVVNPLMTNSSRVNHGAALSEMLAQRVAQHKQQMFETQLINGTQSIFRKK